MSTFGQFRAHFFVVAKSLSWNRSTIGQSKSSNPLPWFVIIICLTLLYQWFRYPFQMSDSGTSPTYGDTPVAVSVAKYIVIAALVGALTVAMWLSKILWLQSRFGLWLALAASFFGLYALARGIYLRSDGLISVGFFALASVMLIIFVTHFSPPLSVMTSILMLFGIVSLAAESIQIIHKNIQFRYAR